MRLTFPLGVEGMGGCGPHTILGTSSRGDLSLSVEDRVRHLAVIGATGSGKSNLLRHIARQDIERGDGLLLLDPMGDLSEAVFGDVPAWRWNHVCFLNVADFDHPVGLNLLEDTRPDDRARAVDGLVADMRSVFLRVGVRAWKSYCGTLAPR
jgi:hypothetical protein